jgi:hypothetical protein
MARHFSRWAVRRGGETLSTCGQLVANHATVFGNAMAQDQALQLPGVRVDA